MFAIYRTPQRLVRLPAAPARISAQHASSSAEHDFQPLDLGFRRQQVRTQRERTARPVAPPRRQRQPVDQNWGDVWPTARSFHPASVPLPLRQGFVAKPEAAAPPGPEANAELMKVTNFLHLTPPVIERQCAAIKRFCTAWPANLTDERLDRERPLEIITQDFVHATPAIRHPDARVVKLQLPLFHLQLDEHARDKLLRLVGPDRHDTATDVVTIIADRCPLRRQNSDYALYLLTVLYFESCKVEQWEGLRADADAEKFVFEGSPSQKAVEVLRVEEAEVVKKYADAVTDIHNVGEDENTLEAYRKAVLDLLNLPPVGENSALSS